MQSGTAELHAWASDLLAVDDQLETFDFLSDLPAPVDVDGKLQPPQQTVPSAVKLTEHHVANIWSPDCLLELPKGTCPPACTPEEPECKREQSRSRQRIDFHNSASGTEEK